LNKIQHGFNGSILKVGLEDRSVRARSGFDKLIFPSKKQVKNQIFDKQKSLAEKLFESTIVFASENNFVSQYTNNGTESARARRQLRGGMDIGELTCVRGIKVLPGSNRAKCIITMEGICEMCHETDCGILGYHGVHDDDGNLWEGVFFFSWDAIKCIRCWDFGVDVDDLEWSPNMDTTGLFDTQDGFEIKRRLKGRQLVADATFGVVNGKRTHATERGSNVCLLSVCDVTRIFNADKQWVSRAMGLVFCRGTSENTQAYMLLLTLYLPIVLALGGRCIRAFDNEAESNKYVNDLLRQANPSCNSLKFVKFGKLKQVELRTIIGDGHPAIDKVVGEGPEFNNITGEDDSINHPYRVNDYNHLVKNAIKHMKNQSNVVSGVKITEKVSKKRKIPC
jgi:hypothetical protein